MFFKTAKSGASEEAIRTITANREDIKRRLEAVEEVSKKLGEAVQKTQELSVSVTDKVNKELKIAKRSLTSISAKMSEGLVMINSLGKIIHMNKTGAKIFQKSEKDVEGKGLAEVISCANPILDDHGNLLQKPILKEDFFSKLSEKIFDRLNNNSPGEKYIICNDCLKAELPFCFESEIEAVLGVKVICDDKPMSLKVTLSVLDNDPESIHDVTYIFLFSTDHK